jgi:hypothetical protein
LNVLGNQLWGQALVVVVAAKDGVAAKDRIAGRRRALRDGILI